MGIGSFFKKIGNGIKDGFENIGDAIKDTAEGVGDVFETVGHGIEGIAKGVTGDTKGAKDAFAQAKDHVGQLGDNIKQAGGNVLDAGKSFGKTYIDWQKGMGDAVSSMTRNLPIVGPGVSAVSQAMTGDFNEIGKELKQYGSKDYWLNSMPVVSTVKSFSEGDIMGGMIGLVSDAMMVVPGAGVAGIALKTVGKSAVSAMAKSGAKSLTNAGAKAVSSGVKGAVGSVKTGAQNFSAGAKNFMKPDALKASAQNQVLDVAGSEAQNQAIQKIQAKMYPQASSAAAALVPGAVPGGSSSLSALASDPYRATGRTTVSDMVPETQAGQNLPAFNGYGAGDITPSSVPLASSPSVPPAPLVPDTLTPPSSIPTAAPGGSLAPIPEASEPAPGSTSFLY